MNDIDRRDEIINANKDLILTGAVPTSYDKMTLKMPLRLIARCHHGAIPLANSSYRSKLPVATRPITMLHKYLSAGSCDSEKRAPCQKCVSPKHTLNLPKLCSHFPDETALYSADVGYYGLSIAVH